MNRKMATSIAAALASGALVAGAVPALAAVTNNSPALKASIHIVSPDKISARGAAVTLTFDVKCPVGAYAQLQIMVTERSGNGLATGSSYLNPPCDGVKHSLPLYLQPTGKAWVVGSASVSADLYLYTDAYGSKDLPAFGTVKFVK